MFVVLFKPKVINLFWLALPAKEVVELQKINQNYDTTILEQIGNG
jgi:hypothetical protein